jgi:hypothetical protein
LLLDDHGRLVSPGRSGDTLADFIMTSMAGVWDNATEAGNSPEKTMILGQLIGSAELDDLACAELHASKLAFVPAGTRA